MIEFASLLIASIVASVLAVETALRLPLANALSQMHKAGKRSVTILQSDAISEHWKERALRAYSGTMFRGSFQLLISILAICSVFAIPFSIVLLLLPVKAGIVATVTRPDVLGLSLAVAMLSLWLKRSWTSHG